MASNGGNWYNPYSWQQGRSSDSSGGGARGSERQMQTQQQTQEYKQLMDRQILLDQIEKTYIVFTNYMQAIVDGNESNTQKGNILMSTTLNLLKAQFSIKGGDDNDGIMMAHECIDRKNMEMKQRFQDALINNRDAHETFLHTTGYINAVFNKESVPTIDAPIIKSLNENAVNNFGSNLIGNASHTEPNRRQEIEKNSQTLYNQQMALLRESKRKNKNNNNNQQNATSRNSRFDVNFLNHHVKMETGPYRGGGKNASGSHNHSHNSDGDFDMLSSEGPNLEASELIIDWIPRNRQQMTVIHVKFLGYDKRSDKVTIFVPKTQETLQVSSKEIRDFDTLPIKYFR